MKMQHLINDTYQIVDATNSVLFQGSKDECNRYMLDKFLNKINDTPELLNVFKRLKDK